MTLFKETYRIESARLREWDYAWPWWYYVTICTKGAVECFGRVVDGEMVLSPLGEIARSCWGAIPGHLSYVDLDVMQIMPNHIHGIIILKEDPRRDVASNVSTNASAMSRISPKRGSLGVVVRSYKSAVTRCAHRYGFPSFAWQSRFYDHVIRHERDLARIRTYITKNVLAWTLDRERVVR